VAQELTLDFHSLKPSAMMQEIHGLGQSPDEVHIPVEICH